MKCLYTYTYGYKLNVADSAYLTTTYLADKGEFDFDDSNNQLKHLWVEAENKF